MGASLAVQINLLLKVKLSTGHSANLGHGGCSSFHNLCTCIFSAAFWQCIQILLWSILSCHHPKHSLRSPLFSPVAFYQSFHNFYPRCSQVVGPPSKSLYPTLLVSDKIRSMFSTSVKLTIEPSTTITII